MSRRVLVLVLLFLVSCATARRPELRDKKEPHGSPDLALDYYTMRRDGTADRYAAYAAARERMRNMGRYATVGDRLLSRLEPVAQHEAASHAPFGRWQFLGPGNVGGRTRVVLIDRTDPRVMYAAGVSGGVWKSRSSGENWEPVGDDLMNIAVNSMAISPADPNVLYAGTGEGYFRENERGTALPLRGNGIYVTRDGAETWAQLPSTNNENFHWVNDIVISTHDASRIYAATRTGVWRSLDGGETWTNVQPVTVKGGCLDLAWRGDTAGDYLFAACGTFEQATVYRNANAHGSGAWQPVLSEEHQGRTTLAIAPSNPNVIYALAASNEPGKKWQGLRGVWRSDSSGDPGSWSAQVTSASTHDVVGPTMLSNALTIDNDICGGVDEAPLTMGWYCNTIAVDPLDANRVWVGGVDLFRSDDGGATWGVASYWWTEQQAKQPAFIHADQHAIVFHPQYNGTTNRIAYFGNDGGVYRTENALAEVVTGKDGLCFDRLPQMSYRSMNRNYGVTQFYHGAVFPDGKRFLGGTQDNGTIMNSLDRGTDGWYRIGGGDGGYVAVDPRNPDIVYLESQFANFRYSGTGGFNTNPLRGGLSGDFLFITPFAIDPDVSRVVWLGGTTLWKNVNWGLWSRASTPMPEGGLVSAIALANSNRIVAGTNKGDIVRTDSGSTATASTPWSVARPRTGFVSSLAFDPSNSSVVYATYAGFGGTHVWMSTDAGATWVARDGSGNGALPDIPVHSIAVDPTRPSRLYLGTDLGVFVSLDQGLTWNVENSGFAAAVTEAVVIGQGVNGPAVYAFTHGRGAWRAELNAVHGRRRGVRK